MEGKSFLGTIHPVDFAKVTDGVNSVSQRFIYKLHFDAENLLGSEAVFDLWDFCRSFQEQWNSERDYYSKIGVCRENDSELLMWDYNRRGEKLGELRVSENGVRLFKDGDGWTMLVGLSLYDSNPFATYSSIAKCFTYMHEQSEINEAQEDSSLARTLLSNNNEDEDCPF